MKKYGLLFLLALTFATPGSARQMICKLEQDYLEKAMVTRMRHWTRKVAMYGHL